MPVTKRTKKTSRLVSKKLISKKPKAKAIKTTKGSLKIGNKKTISKAKTKKSVKLSVQKKSLKKVAPIPKGYATITPYLIVKNAVNALKFYQEAFSAKEILRFANHLGTVTHAEIKIGDSIIMLSEECSKMGAHNPHAIGGTPVMFHLYVKNVDAATKKAIAAGAAEQRPVKDQFYGDRSGCVIDPFGHVWNISTHLEDVSPKEIKRRFAALNADSSF